MKLKKLVAGFCAAVMAMSCFVAPVGAEGDTTNAEVEFSLKYLDSLPKRDEENFDKFLQLPDIDKMDENRGNKVKHKDGSEDQVKVPEKTVYQQIRNEVARIERDVDKGEFEKAITDENRKNEYKSLSRNMKIAGAIYEWVATNIKYDYESVEKDENGQKSFRKHQDALFVYNQKMGVCAGKAELTALMMKMAKIPCAYIGSIDIDDEDLERHAYNAIYLEDNNADRTGWTLLDSTWGATQFDEEYNLNLAEAYRHICGLFSKDKVWEKMRAFLLDKQLRLLQEKYDRAKLNRHCDYSNRLMGIWKELFVKYEKQLQEESPKIIYEINQEMNNEVEKLNTQFTDIITLRNFCLDLDKNAPTRLFIKSEASLSFDDAKKIVDKENFDLNRIKDSFNKFVVARCNRLREYFPSFYDATLDFKSSNEKIIEQLSHKIKEISNCERCNEHKIYSSFYKHELKIDGVKYQLGGKEGNASITLNGSWEQPAKAVKIPPDITKLGMTFEIGSGIESINLEGNMVVNLRAAYDLKNINTDKSDKYIAKDGVLYSRKTKEIAGIFGGQREIGNGSWYACIYDNSGEKVDSILFSVDISNEKNSELRIPEFLTKINIPISITGYSSSSERGCCVETLILERDEIVDLSEAAGMLNRIDISKSKRYKEKDGKVFDTILKTELKFPENHKIEIIK